MSKKVVYTRYHIMMVIGTLKMKLNQGLAVFGMEIQKNSTGE